VFSAAVIDPWARTFNSIEWIRTGLYRLRSSRTLRAFNSIEWIRRDNPRAGGRHHSLLSIPLNGFLRREGGLNGGRDC